MRPSMILILILNCISNIAMAQPCCMSKIAFETNFVKGIDSCKGIFENAKIVGLGESTHNIGTVFEAKVKMIKYLHENLGYNLLVFESGYYDCEKAEEILSSGVKDIKVIQRSIFGIWNTSEVRELYKYIIETHNTVTPLKLAGMDNQFLTTASKYLRKDILEIIDDLNSKFTEQIVPDSMFGDAVDNLVSKSNSYSKVRDVDTFILYKTLSQIINVIDLYSLDTSSKYSFWKNVSINMIFDYRKNHFRKTNFRDSIMAENLFWHYNQKNEKIIIWSANIHLAKNNSSISKKGYNGTMAGSYISKKYQKDYFFLAFTQNYGRGGYSRILSYKFRRANTNSIEHYIDLNYKCDFAILPMSSRLLQNAFFTNPYMKSKLFWTKEIKMKIDEVCDGVFYIKEVKRPKYKD